MPVMPYASTHVVPLTYIVRLFILSGMTEPNSERVITPMPKALVTAIDDFRFSNRVASRAEAVRRLIEIGLEAVQKDAPAKEP